MPGDATTEPDRIHLRAALGCARQALLAQPAALTSAGLGASALLLVPAAIAAGLFPRHPLLAAVVGLCSLLLQLLALLGLADISLRITDRRPWSLADLLGRADRLAAGLAALGSFLALLLLWLLPLALLAAALALCGWLCPPIAPLAGLAVVALPVLALIRAAGGLALLHVLADDSRTGPLRALRCGARLRRADRGSLTLLLVVVLLLNAAGLFTMLVGLAVTLPVSAVAIAHAYRQHNPATQRTDEEPPQS